MGVLPRRICRGSKRIAELSSLIALEKTKLLSLSTVSDRSRFAPVKESEGRGGECCRGECVGIRKGLLNCFR